MPEVSIFTYTSDVIEKRKFHIIDGTYNPDMVNNEVGIDPEDFVAPEMCDEGTPNVIFGVVNGVLAITGIN